MKEKTLIQLAIDTGTFEDCICLAKKLYPYVDCYEVGTPMILRYGLDLVSEMKKELKDKIILADMKIMDAGYEEAELGFELGADIVTVMAASYDSTIEGVVKAAEKYNKKVFVDLLGVNDLVANCERLEKLSVDIIGVHNAWDQQKLGGSPFEELEIVSKHSKNLIAVAGGIKLETIPQILKYNPYIIIIGAGITSKSDPLLEAEKINKIIKYPYKN